MDYEHMHKVEAAEVLLVEAGVPFKIWTPETAQEFIGQDVPEWALWEFLSIAEDEGLLNGCIHEAEALARALDTIEAEYGDEL